MRPMIEIHRAGKQQQHSRNRQHQRELLEKHQPAERRLTEIAIKGIRAMPPRGGTAMLTDAEVHAAVEYMVSKVR